MKVEIQALHDRQGVSVALPDDMQDLTLAEAKKLASSLLFAIEKVEKRDTPPAPGPITHGDLNLAGDPTTVFAECGEKNPKCDPRVFIGGAELTLEDAKFIQTWIDRVFKYFNFEGKK